MTRMSKLVVKDNDMNQEVDHYIYIISNGGIHRLPSSLLTVAVLVLNIVLIPV